MTRGREMLVVAALGTSCLWAAASCSSDNSGGGSSAGSSGTAGSSAGSAAVTAGAAGSATAGASAAGTSAGTAGAGSAGAPVTAGGSGGAAAGAGGTGGNAAGSAGAAGSPVIGVGGGMHTMPTCVTPTPSPNYTPSPIRAGECDYLLQSLDFDSMGYTTTPDMIKLTTFGQAFGLSAINNCSPYCYQKNLTVGIDIVGGATATTQGEIIVEFPATGGGLPITAADMNRNSLAWLTFDGAAKPAFEIDTQLIIETQGGVIVPAVETKPFFKLGGNKNPFGPFNTTNDYSYNNGSEFKYFNTTSGFPTSPQNVTGMGFRIVAKATAGQEWHGVAYIDHLQIRAGSPSNPPGTYPYGLN